MSTIRRPLFLALAAATALAGFLPSEPATYAREHSPLPGALSAVGSTAMEGYFPASDPSKAEARETTRGLAALAGVGPTVPITPTSTITFPAWYKDSNGVALSMCLDGSGNCLGATAADMAAGQADAEAFWWVGEIIGMPVAGGGTASLVLAMEAAFAASPTAAGGEISFGRIRVRATGLIAGATYVVTHPFGSQTYVAAPGPGLSINDTNDNNGVIVARDFTAALSSGIGPFLIWDPAVAPAAPAGYVGDGVTPHKVIGSPTGNNFFRVAGPAGASTDDLFSIVGKLAVSAANDTARVPAGAGAVPIDVLGNDGPGLTVSAVTAPANGASAIAGGGAWVTYDPAVAGTDVFTYTATATGGITGTARVDVTVHAGNGALVAVNDAITVTINSTGTVMSVLANDVDEDLDLKFVSAVTQPAAGGSVAIGVAGTNVVFTPTAAFSGTTSFTYTASDGLASDVGTATVTVNTPPVAVTDVVTVTANTVNNVINVLANDSDANVGNVLTVSAVTTPSSGTAAIGPGGATVLYTPLGNFGGTAVFTYTVTDGAATASAPVTVTVNRPPVAASDVVTVAQNSANNVLSVLANDFDLDGNPIVVSAVTQGANGTVAIGAVGANVLYTPAAGFFGADTFTYTITDGLLSATATVAVTVDRAPAAGDDAFTVTPNTTNNVINVLANDGDPDGNPISVSAVTQPTNGTAAIGAAGANVLYTPFLNFGGTDLFTYTITDGSLTASARITVTVGRPPVAASDAITVAINSQNNALNVLANDSDPDGNPITITGVGLPARGSASVGAGNVVYTPNPGIFGTDPFTYTISDGVLTASAMVTVTVNRPPVAISDAARAPQNSDTNTINVLANDSDPDGNALAVTAITQPPNGAVSTGPGGASVRYVPNTNFFGADPFTYSISDGHLTASATVTMTVHRAPAAADDSFKVPQYSVNNVLDVMANDFDPDGDPIFIVFATQGADGTVSPGQAGTVVYTPNAGFAGGDRFTYIVSDGQLEDTATVTVVVNRPPLALNDVATFQWNNLPSTINVLVNDSDPDADPIGLLSVGSPANGTATIGFGGAVVVYTANQGFSGIDSFSYTISDGQLTANAIVTVIVPKNRPPVAVDDTATTLEDVPVATNVLGNDSDVDGASLSLAGVGAPGTTGTASISGGALLYTPAANFSGSDTFNYTVSDGVLTATARVTVTINPVNDSPGAADDTAVTKQDTPVTITVLANDRDVDGDALRVSGAGTPANGRATTDGVTVSYTPGPMFTGADVFTYTVSDGSLTATGRVTVTVEPLATVGLSPIEGVVITPTIALTATGGLTLTIAFAPGAVSQPVSVTFTLTDTGTVSSTMRAVGRALIVEARDGAGYTVTRFARPFTITIGYRDEDAAGMDENGLRLYYWDNAGGAWVALPTIVDAAPNTLTATLDSTAKLVVMGQTGWRAYAPLLARSYAGGW